MDTPNPSTFDLADFFAGVNYPKIEVPVYLDGTFGFNVYEKQKELKAALIQADEELEEKLESELKELVKKAEDSKFVITVQGIPAVARRRILEDLLEEFPQEIDLFGREKPSLKRDHAYTVAIWTAMLTQIVSPSGQVSLVGQAEVENLLNHAPSMAIENINAAIDELSTGEKSGFEAAAKEVNFLSDASPEG